MCNMTFMDRGPTSRPGPERPSAERPSHPGVPWAARLRASAVDLLAIWAWLGAVAALSRLPVLRRTGYAALFRRPATADAAQFVTGVLPVVLYLAAGEAGGAHASRGKRAAGLAVLGPDGRWPGRRRILVRTAVKLLPWQLAHLAVTRAAGVGVARSPKLAGAGFGVALAMASASVGLAASRPDARTLHDLAAGTRVIATDDPAARTSRWPFGRQPKRRGRRSTSWRPAA
jgi:uncharacterized RDD family membrane protein YckC